MSRSFSEPEIMPRNKNNKNKNRRGSSKVGIELSTIGKFWDYQSNQNTRQSSEVDIE